MKIHNIFHKKITDKIKLNEREKKHLQVLRIKENEKIRVLNGKGTIGYGIFKKGEIIIEHREEYGIKPHINIYLPFLKHKAHRFILRNITSFPIKEITFFPCENSVIHRTLGENDENLLIESIKQSGNPFLPELNVIEHISQIDDNIKLYFGSLNGKKFVRPKIDCENINFLIGPEGGLTSEEEKILITKGFIPVMLSPFTLRSEIAIFTLLGVINEI